jgi:phosphorylcholine metabolism protein LicD
MKSYLIYLIIFSSIIIFCIIVSLVFIILCKLKNPSNLIKLIKKEIIKCKRKKIGIDKNICYQMMNEVGDILNKHGIKFWLSEGTALGVFRDGDLISCDDDVDFGYNDEYYDIFVNNVKPELELKGYEIGISIGIFYNKLKHNYGKYNYVIKNNHVIDFDIVCSTCNCISKNGRKCKELLPFIKKFYKIKFNNKYWNLPSESYYEYLYGKNWRTPLCNKKPS